MFWPSYNSFSFAVRGVIRPHCLARCRSCWFARILSCVNSDLPSSYRHRYRRSIRPWSSNRCHQPLNVVGSPSGSGTGGNGFRVAIAKYRRRWVASSKLDAVSTEDSNEYPSSSILDCSLSNCPCVDTPSLFVHGGTFSMIIDGGMIASTSLICRSQRRAWGCTVSDQSASTRA